MANTSYESPMTACIAPSDSAILSHEPDAKGTHATTAQTQKDLRDPRNIPLRSLRTAIRGMRRNDCGRIRGDPAYRRRRPNAGRVRGADECIQNHRTGHLRFCTQENRRDAGMRQIPFDFRRLIRTLQPLDDLLQRTLFGAACVRIRVRSRSCHLPVLPKEAPPLRSGAHLLC